MEKHFVVQIAQSSTWVRFFLKTNIGGGPCSTKLDFLVQHSLGKNCRVCSVSFMTDTVFSGLGGGGCVQRAFNTCRLGNVHSL